MGNISTVLPSSHEIVASEQHTRPSMHKNKQQNKQNSDKQHFLATEQLRAAAAGRLLKMQFERKSLNSLLTVRTCRQRWSSCLLCHLHLHLHWKTQRLSPPSSTEQVQDHSQAYLTIKLKIDFYLLLISLYLLNHGVDSSVSLSFSDHRALVLITVAIWKKKKLTLFLCYC